MQLAYTHEIKNSETGTTYGNGHGAVDLYIYNTNTGEEKVVRDFTYLEYENAIELQCVLDEQFNSTDAETVQAKLN